MASSDKRMLALAASLAVRSKDRKVDNRTFFFGAVGLRSDGVIVSSRNVAAPDFEPAAHAEARLGKKLTRGSTVWIVRIARKDGQWAMARPCPNCESRLRSIGVQRVIYSISPNEWGVIDMRVKEAR